VTRPKPQAPPAPKKKGRPKKEDVKFKHPGVVMEPGSGETNKEMLARIFDAKESRAQLRWKARLAFTTDVNQITVAQLAQLPAFKAVGLAQLQKWGWTDGWQDERARFLLDLQRRMELAISDEVTRQRLSYLRAIKPAVEAALKRFTAHPFQSYQGAEVTPKNKKGLPICHVCGRFELGHEDPFFGIDGDRVVNSLVKLVDLDLALSEVVVRSVTATASLEGKVHDGTDGPPITANVTTEEARLAAHAILRKRRSTITVGADGGARGHTDPGGDPADAGSDG